MSQTTLSSQRTAALDFTVRTLTKKQHSKDQISLQGPNEFFYSVADVHNGQTKATIDCYGLSDGLTIFYVFFSW